MIEITEVIKKKEFKKKRYRFVFYFYLFLLSFNYYYILLSSFYLSNRKKRRLNILLFFYFYFYFIIIQYFVNTIFMALLFSNDIWVLTNTSMFKTISFSIFGVVAYCLCAVNTDFVFFFFCIFLPFYFIYTYGKIF